jgi:hypothetical protein
MAEDIDSRAQKMRICNPNVFVVQGPRNPGTSGRFHKLDNVKRTTGIIDLCMYLYIFVCVCVCEM